jgi:energy-coupling factor transporter ATP-binding protein EcfA2
MSLIELRQIFFSYPDEESKTEVLHGLSLDVPCGKVILRVPVKDTEN